jgi:geranylgeranyl diphosphate synthase type II
MIDFLTSITEKKKLIDNYLQQSFNPLNNSILKESADYSTNSESKRLRAVLILSVIESAGLDWKKYINLASSIEFLQTATLIHDDLPCMDNGDIRRGKAANHRKFNESIAVLTGDFLFSYTFYNILTESKKLKLPDSIIVKINTVIFDALKRIINGQTEELNYKGNQITESKIIEITKDKTASFIEACLKTGGIISELDNSEINLLSDFGINFGIAFQIADDIIDIIGSDKKEGKKSGTDANNNICTLPHEIGIDKSLAVLKEKITFALNALNQLRINKDILNGLLIFATEDRLRKYNINI